jgi:hypothetical protein
MSKSGLKAAAGRRARYVKDLENKLKYAEDTDDIIYTAEQAIAHLHTAYALLNDYERKMDEAGLLDWSNP